MEVVLYANTSGRGLWSNEKKEVKVIDLRVKTSYSSIEEGTKDNFLYINARFDNTTWRINRDGLIYTDEKWLREFRMGLRDLGMPARLANKVDYTEQGMQGTNYVSLAIHGLKTADAKWLVAFFKGE